MSLKAFHIIFVMVCSLFFLSFGGWLIVNYRTEGDNVSLACAVLCFTLAIASVWYGRWFLRKLNWVSFL